MSKLSAAKILAEIVELGSNAYKTIVDADLARKNADRDAKIRDLERQLAELQRRVDAEKK